MSRRHLDDSFLWRLWGAGWMKMASCCSSWSGLPLRRKYCHACWRPHHSGFNSHESRCRIYTTLKRKLVGFTQVHTRCCIGIGPARTDSWKSIAGLEIPHFFPQLTLRRPKLQTLRPSRVKRGWWS